MLKSLAMDVLVGLCLCALGCGVGTPAPSSGEHSPAQLDSQQQESHEHAEGGPHGGHLVELGTEMCHAELLHDEANHRVTVYLLDASGQTRTGSDDARVSLQVFHNGEFVDYPFPAGPEPGAFTLVDETLCDMLLHAPDVKGRLTVTLAGQDHVGLIQHDPHEHEGHEDD